MSSLITLIRDLPAGVVGFQASGTLSATDYHDVVLPALESAFQRGDVRFLMVITDFSGMSGGALWQDLKVGMEHLRDWRRIALVTDIDWMTHATHLFGWMTPGEIRTFPLKEREEATTWVAG